MENVDKISLTRIMNLIAGEIKQQPRIWIMRILVILGVLVAGALLIAYVNVDGEEVRNRVICESEHVFFVFTLYFLGVIFASNAFTDCQSVKGKIAMLMRPALVIEKYLARFIVYIPLYIMVFILAAYVADAIRVFVTCVFVPTAASQVHMLSVDNAICRDTLYCITIFIGIQSFYWLGAILWPRNSAVKTFFAMMVISVVYNVLAIGFYKVIIGDGAYRFNSDFTLDDYQDWFLIALPLIVAFINYYIAYLRLKETDVVQKLL